uniref:Flap endonuclease GEN chromatin organization modifier domain-containing protein n=1 Tax=Amphilophus citrinellus TaxID=61819 RepID=A0A3Q0RPW9_AMPCI
HCVKGCVCALSDNHRFMQWKEETTEVSEGGVKKVPHCNLCRHPGSAKTHESRGCVLCSSKHFCQPQDFDYQCPCEWHRYEQTRQALSFEANIRRKTRANRHFPFTEIICEFLVSKDKPVSHFKRRKPNMLLMQKFAYDKMEWPRHYTSEKVLVLMTYAELMNRKYGTDMSSQTEPIRIFKPRVRNGIACFEVIWRTPEHFVFPEDRPAEEQHEVRTVEEESLFCLAYPELVEMYLRDKALAEESKTKSKTKPKSKKEKPSDGLSDLLAQMTLQSSSSSNGTAQQPKLLPMFVSTDESEVVILDTPVSHMQNERGKDDCSSLKDCPNTPLSPADSEAVASPSVSVVIEALHLSDIDWDALSFTSSPSQQAATSHPTGPELNKTTDSETEQKTSSDVKSADSRSAPELCYSECPLRDRILMRNTAKTVNQVCNDAVKSKPSGHVSRECSRDLSGKESAVKKNEAFAEKCQRVENALQPAARAQSRKTETFNNSKKVPHKYKFVRTGIQSLTVPPQRCHPNPSPSDRKDKSIPQTIKKSVCMSVCSSSEDSDVENQQSGPQRLTKTKPIHKLKGSFVSDFPLKPVYSHAATKPTAKTAQSLHLPRQKPQSQSEHFENSTPGSTKNNCQEVPAAGVDGDRFLPIPASPVTVLESDDSVICSESPLPLAERLRLKFQK